MKQMWTPLFLCFFVGLVSSEYGWRAGTQYQYTVQGRIVTGLHQVSNQFTGVLMRAKLTIQAKSDSVLSLQVNKAEYADVHANLSSGWDTEIADSALNYRVFNLHDAPFELYNDDGIIKEMTVDKNLPMWEVNILKGIVSLLQVDTQAENLKKSEYNLVPRSEDGTGVYKTMEDSVNGIYETIYDVSLLQDYVLQSQPQLVPLPHLRGKGKIFDIIKNRNFSNSDHHMVYHSGMEGQTNWQPGSNQMGNFLTRTSSSRVVITGNLKNYYIQSSVTTEKIIVAPHFYNKQKGMVGSRMNLTLESVRAINQPISVVNNPKPVRNLVYDYDLVDTKTTLKIFNVLNSVEMTRQHLKDSESSSSSSSSESGSESSQESLHHLLHYKISEPQHTNFIPFFSYNITTNITQNIIKLSREISQGIVSPNILTGEYVLSQFSTLVRLIRTQSAHQLNKISERLYYPYTKARNANSVPLSLNYQAWVSFRDAVAQAGSGPALMTIRDWIDSRKVEGDEASYLVSTLSKSARHPTIEYLDYFFETLSDEVIKSQNSLRMSAVLSFTNLVRRAVVDKRTARNYYPYYIFGQLTNIKDNSVTEKYIPYFQKQLQEAVTKMDSVNIQLNIRALNNIAHPSILSVFGPYLEGKKPITKFQRLTIVASMDKIVKLYPALVRDILYRIYQNLAETPEIRVAAVMHLMKTNPPVQMLQQMAQKTNFDQVKQVNAAVKSAIESVARQQVNEYSREMVEKAKAAEGMLTPEVYGVHYSRNFIKSFIVKEQNLAYKHHLAHIQGDDSIFPSSLFYYLKHNIGGYKHTVNEVQLMTSSVKTLFEQLYGELFGHNQKKRESMNILPESIWIPLNALNLDKEKEEQLEGNVMFDLFGGQQYLAFDNNTIAKIPNLAIDVGVNLMLNNRFNYTKIYNQYSMELAFPTSFGIPFVYSLETPTLANLGLQMKGAIEPFHFSYSFPNIDVLKLSGNVHLLYSSLKESKMGFVTPFNSKTYLAGLERNIQMDVPLNIHVNLNKKQSKVDVFLEPLQINKEQKLLEYSTAAFTTVQGMYSIKSLLSDNNTQFIHSNPVDMVQLSVGNEKSGFAFDVKLETDRKNMRINDLYKNLEQHDLISLLSYADLLLLEEINHQNYTVSLNFNNSWSKSVQFSFAYHNIANITGTSVKVNYNKFERSNVEENFAIPSSNKNGSFQQDLLQNVATGIKDAQAYLIKMYTAFEGKYRTEYEMNFAYADSYLSDVSRILAYIRNATTLPLEPKTYSAAFQVTSEMPSVTSVNYKEALKSVPASKIKGRVDFGVQSPYRSRVIVEGELNSSQERRNYLSQHPLASICEKQMKDDHQLQPACRNITRRINYLDNYHFNIDYKGIPDELKNVIYLVYKYINQLWYEYTTENTKSNNREENIDVNVKFGKSLLSTNLSIIASEFSHRFENVPIHEWVRPLVVVHPQYNMIERLGYKIFAGQDSPVCTFDKDLITNFDNSSYYIKTKNMSYTLVENIPENYITHEYFGIIAHQLPSELLELKIVIRDNILRIIPGGDDLGVNFIYLGQEMPVPKFKQLLDNRGKVIFKMLALPGGIVKIIAEENGFEIIYLRKRASINVADKFRGQLRGLCGNFDGETYNDFITPQKCIMRDSKEFIASYGLLDLSSNSSVGMMKAQQESPNPVCYKLKYSFGNVVDEEEVKQYMTHNKY